jgi:ATP-dependent Clp protease protease subunit
LILYKRDSRGDSEMADSAPKTDEVWVLEFNTQAAQEFRDAVVSKSKQDINKPIVVYIDSYGGNVDALAKMISTLEEIPNPIVTVCQGKAMSAGAILLSHGDIRFCDPHSRVMIHEVSSGTAGDVNDMHVDTEEAKRLNSWMLDLLAKNCGYSSHKDIKKFIKDGDGRDVYLGAEAALKFGIVDFVGTPTVLCSVQYEVACTPDKQRIRDLILQDKLKTDLIKTRKGRGKKKK